jgi:hypothetical protein
MTGLSTYTAQNLLNYITGQTAEPVLPSVWLALFTASGSDDGTGFTEVTGGSYARLQVGGNAATNATTASGNAILHFASTPAWVTPGMTAYDATTPASIPLGTTVLSVTSTTVTLSANATGAGVGSGDTINFSAFGRASGTGPSQITNTAAITFPAATASWGTVVSFGLYDASTVGNLLLWDWLGNFNWLPCTITSASPGVFTAKANGYANGDPVVFSTEYGGTAPTGLTPGNTIQTVAGVSGADNFNVSVNTTSTGSGNVRKITQQSIPTGVTASFAAGALVSTAA